MSNPAYEFTLPSPHLLFRPLGGNSYEVYRDGGKIITFAATPPQHKVIKANNGQLNISTAQVKT